jgi:hypothetical protein
MTSGNTSTPAALLVTASEPLTSLCNRFRAKPTLLSTSAGVAAEEFCTGTAIASASRLVRNPKRKREVRMVMMGFLPMKI